MYGGSCDNGISEIGDLLKGEGQCFLIDVALIRVRVLQSGVTRSNIIIASIRHI